MVIDASGTSDKHLALELIRLMPDDSTLTEIREEIAILAAIRQGEAAANAGRVLPHEEVRRRSVSWVQALT